jgi:hypothetical protein
MRMIKISENAPRLLVRFRVTVRFAICTWF